jgi:ribose 5-phosphate isomerase A
VNSDEQKKKVAEAALDFVERGMVVGVGTGTTANHFIDALGRHKGRFDGAVASSRATADLLARRGVRVLDLNEVGQLPLYVDGADQADLLRRLIKGGGGAHTREKIAAAASEQFLCIIDESKLVERLGTFPVALEVIEMGRRHVIGEVAKLDARAVPREGFVSDNGHPLLDVHGLVLDDPPGMEANLDLIAGVVANGLFCRRPADRLLVGRGTGVELLGP